MGFLKKYWKWILLAELISLLIWGVPRLSNDWQLEHRQMELMKAIADRKPGVYTDLVSQKYLDEWQFNTDKVQKAMDDVAVQFLTLNIVPEAVGWQKNGKTEATWQGHLRFKGTVASPIGQMILDESQKLKEPFSFVWTKESWTPWSWKLSAVTNPALEVPSDYQPGMLSGRGMPGE